MQIVDHLELSFWEPDFSGSDQENPRWTRASWRDLELTNSVEWVEWANNPVQVGLCACCGQPDCNDGNYVHIARLGDFVLWTVPQIDEIEDWEAHHYRPPLALQRFGALAFERAVWGRLAAVDDALPSLDALPVATRRVLADAWRYSVDGPARADNLNEVLPGLRRILVASDRFEPDEAIELLSRLVDWLGETPDEPISGTLGRASTLGAEVETLYFDGPGTEDWPAFALLGSRPVLALSRDLVFLPDDLD